MDSVTKALLFLYRLDVDSVTDGAVLCLQM